MNDVLNFLSSSLRKKIMAESTWQEFPAGTEILREEQYVKMLPLVVEGLVKVYSQFDERELLLYYIEPEQSCVMSFYAALNNSPSKVFACTEAPSKLLLLPVRHLPSWLREYPDLNLIFYQQFNLRYTELLETIRQLLLDKMDKRIYDHLKKKVQLRQGIKLKMTHGQIATELGTAREVVSRIMKKLEMEGKISQSQEGLEIFDA